MFQFVLAGAKRLGSVVVGLVVGAVHPDDVVLFELSVEVGVAELHWVEPDPLGPAAIEADAGYADRLAVGLAGVRVSLDGDHYLSGLLTWPRRFQPDRSCAFLWISVIHLGRLAVASATEAELVTWHRPVTLLPRCRAADGATAAHQPSTPPRRVAAAGPVDPLRTRPPLFGRHQTSRSVSRRPPEPGILLHEQQAAPVISDRGCFRLSIGHFVKPKSQVSGRVN